MPITPSANLRKTFLDASKLEMVPVRNGFGEGLLEAAKNNDKIVGLCADLTESTRMEGFAQAFPERFVEIGVAEQNLVTVASGMAHEGKIPFTSSYATFSPGRNWEQIRTTICYNNQPVIVVGSHAGLSVGPDGATHQALEDVALMRVLPNMQVIVPADYQQAHKATLAIAKDPKPTYLRLAREKSPVFTTTKTPFTIGKADVYYSGKDVTIIGAGPVLYEALIAADMLKGKVSVEVINLHTIKPIDKATILRSVKKTRAVVTVEEHQITGGLGGAVAELLAKELPTPMEFVGVCDRFGESGSPMELWEHFGMGPDNIIDHVNKVLKRKV
ncbi:MAG: transketolase [Candidatus Kerfeldbacteria bacterium CG15_BIG_FIL_POST_REV_8_21_14_020_45_12]|uniref:Transketolase n=1 Tax=Candidatus Kerfeldbacteria bacterium CG15_BIG_FIL_POST_REV_8_21_14_020_45_12 TaxID=2014247 RepID=A0A2M7H458_9BACT|nr:MAG: transketolase [Candidatus Kerfeldbacteria bacterium CG15_BIG_FIL_POST_REV_8_21_14_020_45_12]